MGCVWWASSFSGWILALGACAVERRSDLRKRQANVRVFLFFPKKRNGQETIISSPYLKMNGGFAAMRQQ